MVESLEIENSIIDVTNYDVSANVADNNIHRLLELTKLIYINYT
jgi:hypothetical protein